MTYEASDEALCGSSATVKRRTLAGTSAGVALLVLALPANAAAPAISLSATANCPPASMTAGATYSRTISVSGTITRLIPGNTYYWHDYNGDYKSGYATLGVASSAGVLSVSKVGVASNKAYTAPVTATLLTNNSPPANSLVATFNVRVTSTCSTLRSPGHTTLANGTARLIQQGDGNLVLYRGGRALWQSHTYPHPGATTTLQSDGNLVVNAPSGTPLWSSRTVGYPHAFLNMQPDGNLVIYSGTNPNRALWQTHTY